MGKLGIRIGCEGWDEWGCGGLGGGLGEGVGGVWGGGWGWLGGGGWGGGVGGGVMNKEGIEKWEG